MHEGHRKRIREKYRRNGLDGFADHEVLELLLFYSNKRSDTNETAHRLLERFGSLSAVLEAPYDELVQVEDIGDVAATLITMVPALFRRYSADKVSSITEIGSAQQAIDYSKPKFFGLSTERGALIFLDSQNRIKNFLFVCEGSLNTTSLDIRKCVQLALNNNASSVILVHNHPTGVASPSRKDVETTQALVATMAPIGIAVSDHIILTDSDAFSMASHERLATIFQR